MFSSYIRMYMILALLTYIGDVYSDHVVKGAFARLLHCKVTIFALSIEEWEIYFLSAQTE